MNLAAWLVRLLAAVVLTTSPWPASAGFEAVAQRPEGAPAVRVEEARPGLGARAVTDHLEVTGYVAEELVRPGSPFTVVLEVVPRPGIHVYAPEAKGYKVVALNLVPHALVVSRPTVYPASEIYFFKPLNERVPVYQKPFRLTRRLAITSAPEHRSAVSRLRTLTVRASLDYQACDDRVCFIPASVPMSLTVKVGPVGAGRAARPSAP